MIRLERCWEESRRIASKVCSGHWPVWAKDYAGSVGEKNQQGKRQASDFIMLRYEYLQQLAQEGSVRQAIPNGIEL
jgi:hypothetical protein